MHFKSPCFEYVPEGHELQSDLYSFGYLPVEQLLQEIEPKEEYVPFGHGVHSESPTFEYVPAGQ